MNVRLIVNWREYQTLCRVSSVTVAKYLKRFSVTEQTQTFSKIYFPWKVSVQLKNKILSLLLQCFNFYVRNAKSYIHFAAHLYSIKHFLL